MNSIVDLFLFFEEFLTQTKCLHFFNPKLAIDVYILGLDKKLITTSKFRFNNFLSLIKNWIENPLCEFDGL